MNWPLLQNSLLVSGATTLLAVAFGFAGALCLASIEARWRRPLLVLVIIAMALPPFLVTNCWLDLLGQTGRWRVWFPFNIFSRGGTLWILALLTWPVTLLLVLSAWSPLESIQLEAEPSMRGWRMIRWMLWPMARPTIGLAAVLTFALAFNNFAVPAILQTKVFPAELWVSFSTTFNYGEVLKLSWPLLVAPILLLLCLGGHGVPWPRVEGRVSPGLFRRQLGCGWFSAAAICFLTLASLSVALPLFELARASRTWVELPGAFAAGRTAVWNSFFLAALTATLCTLMAFALWPKRFPAALWILFFLPGVLLGVVLIFALNRPWSNPLYQSVGIVVLGLALRYVVLNWTGVRHAMQSLDADLTSAAKIDGTRGWELFRHVHWPQIAPTVAATWYVTYLLCLWDVETLVLIAPPGGETLSLRIFNLLHFGHNTQVNALCLILLGLAVAPLLVSWMGGMFFKMRKSAEPERDRFILTQRSGGRRETQKESVSAAFSIVCVTALTFATTGCDSSLTRGTVLHSKLFSSVEIIGTWGTAPGQLNKPRSLTLDAQDNLYVVDMTGRVQKFSPDGKYLAHWQMPQTDLGKPKGMCRDADGNIVVIEPHYCRVNHFSPDGKLVRQWGERGTNAGQLTLPRAAAINSRGEIFMCEYTMVDRVQQFSKDGIAALKVIGRPGTREAEFNRAEGIGIDKADRIYVADSCNHRVQVFEPDGKFLRAYGGPGSAPGEMSYPYDVQIDTAGYQFVCEFGNSRVQVFGADGKLVEILGRAGSEPGKFNNPWALALDSKGNLYVADSRNNRVQKFVRRMSLASGSADH